MTPQPTPKPAKKYPAPKPRDWIVQVEFFDGTVIDATSDDDAIERWRRVAAWTDPTAETHALDWMARVLMRARTVYQAALTGITPSSTSTEILDALADENCLYLRRKD